MLKSKSVVLFLSIIPFLFFGCTSRELETEQIQSQIQKVNESFISAFSQSDAAKMAAFYASDAELLPPNSEFVQGQKAIESFWSATFDAGIKKITLETLDAQGIKDMAHEVGKYTLYGNEDQIIDTGKYIVIWKKVKHQWKLYRDIWNSSMPLADKNS